MCGIVAAAARREVSDILLEGLRRLEYRGYDFFFFKQKTAYEVSACLVGSEMCIRDSLSEGKDSKDRGG